MSATFKNAKRKLIQTEFRRALSEHKNKLKDVKKIDSPLAKYNDQGQLTCILCKSVVRSETVWPVHINSKQHKENIELAKRLKQRTNNFTTPLKRSITPPLIVEVPEKKPKGILKNSTSRTKPEIEVEEKKNGVPEDFFDNSPKQPPILPIRKPSTETMEIDDDHNDEALPEGFFDDPKQDAKARNQEYKDPVEEEWEKFQKEIREAGNKSAAIIAEDQEEATTERQIDEIDEQLKKLSKVLDLEKKKEHIISVCNEAKIVENDNSDDDDFNEFDEFLDWRSKKSFK